MSQKEKTPAVGDAIVDDLQRERALPVAEEMATMISKFGMPSDGEEIVRGRCGLRGALPFDSCESIGFWINGEVMKSLTTKQIDEIVHRRIGGNYTSVSSVELADILAEIEDRRAVMQEQEDLAERVRTEAE